MNWDRLKNRIQQDASKKEVNVDIDEIWAAIEPEVDVINNEKRKKRFFFFWILGLGLAITIGSFYYFFSGDSSNQDLVKFEKIEKTTSEEAHANAHAHSHEHHGHEHNHESKIQTVKEESATNNFSTKKETTKNQNTNQSIATTSKKETLKNLPWKISQSNQDQLQTNEFENPDLILSKVTDNQSVTIVDDQTIVTGNQIVTDTRIKQIPKEVNIAMLSGLGFNLPIPDRGILNNNDIANYYLVFTPEEIKRILEEREEEKRKLRGPKFTFGVGLMGGIGKAPNNLKTKNDTISSLLLIRRETESSLETNQVGIEFSLRHQSGLSLTSGLQQTTMVEKVAFDDTVTEVNMIDGITEVIVSPNGDSTYVWGTIPETVVTTIEKKQYVRYKLLEVPLILGWQTKDKNETGWRFGVETGVVPNISLTTKGIIFDEDYGDVNLATDQPSYFKKNIGMSYHLGFSVRRMLFDNVELSFKPTVRFFPNDFSADGNPISQKYNLVSGQIGVNYIFGN